MKRVISLPLMIVLLLSFVSFGETSDSTVKSKKETPTKEAPAKEVSTTKGPRLIDEAGNWSKIKSLFL